MSQILEWDEKPQTNKAYYILRKIIVTPTNGDNFWECESHLFKDDEYIIQ